MSGLCLCGAPKDEHRGASHTGGHSATGCRRWRLDPLPAQLQGARLLIEAKARLRDALQTPGVTVGMLSQLSGLTSNALRALAHNRATYITPHAHAAVMALTGPLIWHSLRRTEQARARIRTALALPRVTLATLAALTGLPLPLLRSLHRGGVVVGEELGARLEQISATAVRAFLATPAAAPAPVSRLDDPVRLARCLAAQGWGTDWQAARYDRPRLWVRDLLEARLIPTAEERELVCRSAAWVDGAPRRGESPWGPDRAAAEDAQARGWYPLACYDEESGAYVPRSRRARHLEALGHSLAELTAPSGTHHQALRVIAVLRTCLAGTPARSAARALAVSERQVQRDLERAGVHFSVTDKHGHLAVVRPAYAERAEQLRAAIRDFDHRGGAATQDPRAFLAFWGIPIGRSVSTSPNSLAA